jgi:hypothetical protein
MATPTATASLDRAEYAKGDTMRLTVSYDDPDTETMTVSVVVADKSGNTSAPHSVEVVIDPVTVSVTDSGGREWTQESDDGAVAVWLATA